MGNAFSPQKRFGEALPLYTAKNCFCALSTERDGARIPNVHSVAFTGSCRRGFCASIARGCANALIRFRPCLRWHFDPPRLDRGGQNNEAPKFGQHKEYAERPNLSIPPEIPRFARPCGVRLRPARVILSDASCRTVARHEASRTARRHRAKRRWNLGRDSAQDDAGDEIGRAHV